MKVVIKKNSELTQKEIGGIHAAKYREWQIESTNNKDDAQSTFFLLKEAEHILAQGETLNINGITFGGKSFDILGIGGIIANEKGKGYGRQIMLSIADFIRAQRKTGIGFTNKPVFYEKCGFQIDCNAWKRFVFLQNEARILPKEGECILYLDGPDAFMRKVLSAPSEDIFLPRTPDW